MGNVLSRCANEVSNVLRSCRSQKGDEERKQMKGAVGSRPFCEADTSDRLQRHDHVGEGFSKVHNTAQGHQDMTVSCSKEQEYLPECDQSLDDKAFNQEPMISKEFIIQTYRIASHSSAASDYRHDIAREGGENIEAQRHASCEASCYQSDHHKTVNNNMDTTDTEICTNQPKAESNSQSGLMLKDYEINPRQLQPETTILLKPLSGSGDRWNFRKDVEVHTKNCKDGITQTHNLNRTEVYIQTNGTESVTDVCKINSSRIKQNLMEKSEADLTESHKVANTKCHEQQKEGVVEDKQEQVLPASSSAESGSNDINCPDTFAMQSGGEEQLPDRVRKLEQRQEAVLQELQKLQQGVQSMAQQRGVSLATAAAPSTSTAAATSSSQPAPLQGGVLQDLVISVDPSCVPLSLLVLLKQLSRQYQVLTSTFVHSSATDTPQNLRSFLQNGASGAARSNYQLSVSVVWKKIPSGPRLMVSPTRQTYIEGEANIARYLSRLLQPAYDSGDIVAATQIDEVLDLAQQQLLQGNNKERSAALRTLNARLGKGQWLVGSCLSVADVVAWSAVQGVKLASDAPANVKKWLKVCAESQEFAEAVKFLTS